MKVYNCTCRQSKLIYCINFLTTEKCFYHGVLYKAGTGQPAAACPAFWKTFSMEFATLNYFIQKNLKDLLYGAFQTFFAKSFNVCH